MGLPKSFKETNPASCEDVEEFEYSEAIIKAVNVVNDHVERGMALVHEYSGLVTNGEEQLQCSLQVTAEQRKVFLGSKNLL